MALELYRQKRNFQATSEPKGRKARKAGMRFVIQKHAARRLHYDLRLEIDGVYKSWAVTRGPSLVAGEKRLAVHVEDHPVEYGTFEGTIPKGEYGAGSVIVWDRGTWRPTDDPQKGYDKGHLEFDLSGEKLEGRWHLVRMHGRKDGDRDNWLLIKAEDAAARTPDAPDILEQKPHSVASGRSIDDVTAGRAAAAATPKSDDRRARASAKRAAAKAAGQPSPMPDFIAPALATLAARPPAGRRWLHEIKLDGYRLQARIENGAVRLITRSGLDWTAKFGTGIAGALARLPARTAIIDGEVVVEAGSGATDFSLLQQDLSEDRVDRFRFFAFDLLHLDGDDLTGQPLRRRKATLETLLKQSADPVAYNGHFEDGGEMVLRHACRLSLEGIVSKVADAPYRSGRSRDWIKSKCSSRQELVIGGFVPSTVAHDMIGSLVMGVYDGDRLHHVGRVGTGYTASVARDLFGRLSARAVAANPFSEKLTGDEARNVVSVVPELVAEIEFRGWTADRHLRHASFRGIREDKEAREVVLEHATDNVEKSPVRTVTLTHPDRVYWPGEGITKAGLADYYSDVWRYMAPFVVGRPLSLLRGPEGIDGDMFFQKHAWRGLSRHVTLVGDPADGDGASSMAITDLDGLIGLVQGGVLEIHPWGSTLADWEKPDMVIMDLDPGPDVSWETVIQGALDVRARLEALGLATFVKTSGGKGLHVVSPLKPRAEWPEVKAAMKAVALAMAADDPGRYVATVTKSKRHGKIFVDYLRNGRGATAVAPYSTRARPGAAVSMPIAWEELDASIGPAHFTVENAPLRMNRIAGDPWADFRADAVALPAAATKAGGHRKR